MDNLYEDLIETLKREAPDLELEESADRSWDAVSQFLVFASSVGIFSGLWKVIDVWINHHASASVKISYTATDGTNIEIVYNNKTSKEVNELIAKHNPREKFPVKLSVHRNAKKSK